MPLNKLPKEVITYQKETWVMGVRLNNNVKYYEYINLAKLKPLNQDSHMEENKIEDETAKKVLNFANQTEYKQITDIPNNVLLANKGIQIQKGFICIDNVGESKDCCDKKEKDKIHYKVVLEGDTIKVYEVHEQSFITRLIDTKKYPNKEKAKDAYEMLSINIQSTGIG